MRVSNPKRFIVIAAAVLMMTSYQLSPMPAWACSTSNETGFAYASKTGPNSITVCAKSVTGTRTVVPAPKVTPVKEPALTVQKAPSPKGTPKPSPTPIKVVTLLTSIKKGVPEALQKPKPKPAPKPIAAAPKTKLPAKTGLPGLVVASTTSAGEVSFSPAPISVLASAAEAAVGQEITFWTNAATHYKAGVLLGKATEVRFTPIQTVWSSDQSHSELGGSIALTFETAGRVEVAATVTYSVAYQVGGSSGWLSSGEILVSESITASIVEVSRNPVVETTNITIPPEKKVRLVGQNCLVRPKAFGCN
jgi:hypothetical protein